MSAPLARPLADTLFIAEFRDFCRTKGDERYSYTNSRNCACAQFLRATGRAADPRVTPATWREGPDGARTPLPAGVNDTLSVGNFSALADRLESLLTDTPIVERVQ